MKLNLKPVSPSALRLDHYRNTAAIDWMDEAGNNHHSEDNKPFKPLPAFDLNAQKSGVYNAGQIGLIG
jgi:uncharacterized surface anchored protein